MPRCSPLPPAIAGVPFAASTAIDLGVSRGRLRGSDLAIPFRGTRIGGAEPLTIPLLARAYATRMPDGQVFSHWTAAILLDLRLPEGARGREDTSSLLHVAVRGPDRAPRRKGIRGHEVVAQTKIVRAASGLRVTSPIDTWIQLARVLSVDDLIVMGDGLLSRKDPRATMAQLVSAVALAVNLPGIARLREALEGIRANTDSARETMLRLLIVRGGLPEPEVNAVITNRYGATIGLGDLVYAKERVLVEYDGRGHWDNDRQFARDIRRLDEFMEEGWRVIRVDKALMAQTATLLGKIRTALEQSDSAP